MQTDINCDVGEGIGNDEFIMPFISSANIACGYHAGDATTIKKAIALCIKHNVAIGAHPSFFDKKNFGRTEMNLPPDNIYNLLIQQLITFKKIADSLGKKINHIKPHGALYNMSARDASVAKIIAKAINDFDNNLLLIGLSGSHSISEGKKAGLKTANEVFADRTYQEDGKLTQRSSNNALIEDPLKATQQALQMLKEGTVTTVTGKEIRVIAETICIHGDGKHAIVFARAIYEHLKQNNIEIKSF